MEASSEQKASKPRTLGELGYLEIEEVATLTGKKPRTLANWRAQEVGPPFVKVGGTRVVYPMKGLEKWLADQVVTPGKKATLVDGSRSRRR